MVLGQLGFKLLHSRLGLVFSVFEKILLVLCFATPCFKCCRVQRLAGKDGSVILLCSFVKHMVGISHVNEGQNHSARIPFCSAYSISH